MRGRRQGHQARRPGPHSDSRGSARHPGPADCRHVQLRGLGRRRVVRLRGRRGARLAAITSGGAIPDTALFTVVAQPDEIVVGTVDEDFAVESNAGDIMLLGNTSWRIRRIESNSGRMLVEDAHGAPPSIPFWRGEAPARTDELSHHVAELRERVSALLPN